MCFRPSQYKYSFLKLLGVDLSHRLDTSPSSVHLKRRIWQEAVSTLVFTDPETHIPEKQEMVYAQARDSEYPPYLLDFTGSPGERHAENIKVRSLYPVWCPKAVLNLLYQVLREVGTSTYATAVGLLSGPDKEWYRYLESEIQRYHVGPDCYWKDPQDISTTRNFFGNAWWIPFPPSLVRQSNLDCR